MSNGNFVKAFIWTAIITIFLFTFFIVPQFLKGTESRFNTRIVIERILLGLSPFVFIAIMMPAVHFFNIYDNRDYISQQFATSIESSKEIFMEYEEYSDNRITQYETFLNDVVKNKKTNPQQYNEVGFTGRADITQTKNRVEALRMQLIEGNYKNTNQSAITWINKSTNEPSVWNIFLLGSVEQIQSSVAKWHDELLKYSEKKITSENNPSVFDKDGTALNKFKSNFSDLCEQYTTVSKIPTHLAIIVIIFCYLFMIFPYILQDRHSKNTYRLLGDNNSKPNQTGGYNISFNDDENDNSDDNSYGGSFTL